MVAPAFLGSVITINFNMSFGKAKISCFLGGLQNICSKHTIIPINNLKVMDLSIIAENC